MAHISDHAVQRYQERIERVDASEARAAMLSASDAIDTAAEFGCNRVVLGNGARLVLQGKTVVTVKEKRHGKRPRG